MRGRRADYRVTFGVIALATLSYALLQSLVAPALPTLEKEFDASTTATAWVFTGYLLAFSVVTPIAGKLGDMHGKRRVLIASLAAVVVGSAVCALAGTIEVLVAGRVIQALGGGVFPLGFGIVRDEFPRERVTSGIALISAILGVGAGFGIVLAGPIIEHLGYHWLFWLPFIVSLVPLVAAILIVPESPNRAPGKVDLRGAGLLAAWLVALLLAVSQAPSWGWGSARVIGLLVAAAVLAAVWVLVEDRAPSPLVDMTMMRLRTVWATNLTALLLGFAMYASFVLIPQFVEMPASTGYGFGASVTQAGLYLLPSTLAMLVVSLLAARLSHVVRPRTQLAAGAVFVLVTFCVLVAAHSESWQIYLASTLLGIGVGLAYSSMANLVIGAVRPEQTGVASGMNTITRTIGGSIGAEVSASILAASLVAGLPSEHGFTRAFAVCAVVAAVSFVASLMIPARSVAPHAAAHPAASES